MGRSTWNPFRSLLVSPLELHAALDEASPSPRRIVPVAAGRDTSLKSFQAKHIPGSVYASLYSPLMAQQCSTNCQNRFFNMDQIRDTRSPYPQMVPSPSHFATCMAKLGICPDDILVVYDALEVGLYSSPRAAWVCRHFGHADVHVLNNFPCYVDNGYPVSQGELVACATEEDYPQQEPPEPSDVIDFEELDKLLSANKDQRQYQILDARPESQFSGADTGDGVSGHMPSALNIPLSSLLGEDKTMLPAPRLRELFQEKGIRGTSIAILSCNSGVTAAALELALQVSGYQMRKRIYDGSWSEWKMRAKKDGLIIVD